jgi:hypothetical protein
MTTRSSPPGGVVTIGTSPDNHIYFLGTCNQTSAVPNTWKCLAAARLTFLRGRQTAEAGLAALDRPASLEESFVKKPWFSALWRGTGRPRPAALMGGPEDP